MKNTNRQLRICRSEGDCLSSILNMLLSILTVIFDAFENMGRKNWRRTEVECISNDLELIA